MAEQVKVIKIDTQPAQTSVKELRTQLKALKDTMLSCEQGTEEYNEALQKAADIQHTLKEQMEEVNASAMDFGQIASNSTQALGGMIGGFQAATAVMNLFGTENEDVIKTLKTMQQLMSITQALPAIDKGIKAFKALGIAIKASSTALKGFSAAAISTGIGAVVVALGLLIANWDKVTAAMQKWGIISEDTEAKLKEQEDRVKGLREELSKLEGSYEDWQKQQQYSKINSKAKKSFDDLTTSITDYQKQLDIIVAKQKLPENQSRDRWESLQKEGQALQEQITLWKNQQRAILDNADSYKELKKATGEVKNSYKELEVILWDATQKLAPQSLQDELMTKYRENPITIPVEIEIEDEEEDTSFEDAFRQRIEGTINSLRQAFGISEEEQYQMELQALEVSLNTKLIKEEEYYRLRDALNKEYTQREIQRYSIAAAGIGQIFTNLSDLMEEGSEEQKALQIMGATINMLGGITAAIAGVFTTHTGPWDIALAAIQAASIATSGAATIAKMTKTNQRNASTMAGNPNTAAIGTLIAPVQYTQDVQGANIEGAIKDSKVYVTETDITNTQNRVKVSETEARF